MEPIRIFAKKGTKEKVALLVPDGHVKTVMFALTDEFGGDWIPVQTVRAHEMIKFEDDLEYKGYHPDFKTYCSAIVDIPRETGKTRKLVENEK